MARQVVIIHGWSDTSDSFRPLAAFLTANGFAPKELWLGDYISLDDDVRVADVGKRMGQVVDQLIASGELAASFDVIVHSTGGLVAREWLTTRYRGEAQNCPMKRLIMLAPANFGSKLAATGKSLLGRVFKGFRNGFQTGTGMLNDLELASSYQWELAQRDILRLPGADDDRCYGADRVWPFVIVGTHPYASLLRQLVNEDGADGTVRVCAANLNARGVTIDFRYTDPARMFQPWESRLETDIPLAVLPTRTHGSIIDPDRSTEDSRESIPETAAQKAQLGALILQALRCQSFADYQGVAARWDAITEATAALSRTAPEDERDYYHQYMQANFYVIDDIGQPVPDYFLEFYSNTAKRDDAANIYLHSHVIEDVKVNTLNKASRNVYFDRTDLVEGYYRLVPPQDPAKLFLSISAAPVGRNVSYFAPADASSGNVPIHVEGDKTKRWLRRNATHFVQIIIPRTPGDDVFRLKKAGA